MGRVLTNLFNIVYFSSLCSCLRISRSGYCIVRVYGVMNCSHGFFSSLFHANLLFFFLLYSTFILMAAFVGDNYVSLVISLIFDLRYKRNFNLFSFLLGCLFFNLAPL